MYYWDGRSWVTTLSPDGRHRWNGEAWVPMQVVPHAQPGITREPTPWTRPIQYAVAAWCGLGAVVGLSLPYWMGGMMSQLINQSIRQQEQLNPEATPLPAGFSDAMTSFMAGVVWFAALFTFALYGIGFFGAVRRWTWTYYAVLVLLGLGLVGLPLNIVNAVTGQVATTAGSVQLPSWLLYWSVAIGTVQVALFVWMLVAIVRYGPWAMRRVS
jgi:hypothetical protein